MALEPVAGSSTLLDSLEKQYNRMFPLLARCEAKYCQLGLDYHSLPLTRCAEHADTPAGQACDAAFVVAGGVNPAIVEEILVIREMKETSRYALTVVRSHRDLADATGRCLALIPPQLSAADALVEHLSHSLRALEQDLAEHGRPPPTPERCGPVSPGTPDAGAQAQRRRAFIQKQPEVRFQRDVLGRSEADALAVTLDPRRRSETPLGPDAGDAAADAAAPRSREHPLPGGEPATRPAARTASPRRDGDGGALTRAAQLAREDHAFMGGDGSLFRDPRPRSGHRGSRGGSAG